MEREVSIPSLAVEITPIPQNISPFSISPGVLDPILPSLDSTPKREKRKCRSLSEDLATEDGFRRISEKLSPDAPKFLKRLYRFRDTAMEKTLLAQLANRKKERSLCPFAPTLISKRGNSQGHTTNDMYKEACERRNRRDSEEDLGALGTFRPSLSERTKEITRGRDPTKIYGHLYSLSTGSMKTISPGSKYPFKPTINKRSEELIRSQPVEVHLYEDAQRRLKSHIPPHHSQQLQNTLSKRSLQILAERFQTEFTAVLKSYSAPLSFTQVYSILIELYFIRKGEERGKELARVVYDAIRKELGVDAEDLCLFLMAVGGLPTEAVPVETANQIHSIFHDMWITRKCMKPTTAKRATTAISRPFRTEDYLKSLKLEANKKEETRRTTTKQLIKRDFTERQRSDKDEEQKKDEGSKLAFY